MTSTEILHRERAKLDNDRALAARSAQDAVDLQALARHAADLTDNYRRDMMQVIRNAAFICNDVDEADEWAAVEDRLTDIGGETFRNWPDYAERMQRLAGE